MANPLVTEAIGTVTGIISQAGKALLSAQYPNDFEYYMVAFELVVPDSNTTLQYLTLPINPSSIQYSFKPLTNIKKTFGGITSLGSTTSIPVDISLSGDFGRSFKVMVDYQNNTWETLPKSFQGVTTGDKNLYLQEFKERLNKSRKGTFSNKVKTGYGVIKALENLITESVYGFDPNGNPLKLYFYNPSLGHAFEVKAGPLRLTQNQDKNMIPGYSLQLTGIRDISSGLSFMDRVKLASSKIISDGLTDVGNSALKLIL